MHIENITLMLSFVKIKYQFFKNSVACICLCKKYHSFICSN